MIKIGTSLFNPSTRRVLGERGETRLSPKAAGVLAALAETPHRVWSRGTLLERVWPRVVVGEEVLTHAVAELRRALADDFRAPRHIETVHKSGYRLLAAAGALENRGAAPQCDRADTHVDACTYDNCLRAFELCNGGEASAREAVALCASAIERRVGFAAAQAGRALSPRRTREPPGRRSFASAPRDRFRWR